MREALISDKEYVAECFINICRYIKSQASDIYIDGLPSCVDQGTLDLAESYILDNKAVVYIVEHEGQSIACIAGKIENTSFSPSGVGLVGNIAICWVEEEFRTQRIGTKLLMAVESWFADQGISVTELSYLAQNSLAEEVWSKSGYVPFRVFSHKVIKNT